MNKLVRVILINEAEKEYLKLNGIVGQQIKEGTESSEEIQLLKSIKQKIEFIKANPFYGDNIPKRLIPPEYQVHNLWRVELTHFWRMLYTIKGDQIEVVCFVLDIIDHNKYNKMSEFSISFHENSEHAQESPHIGIHEVSFNFIPLIS